MAKELVARPCRYCGAEVARELKRCPECGRRAPDIRWFTSKPFILAMLFMLTGPFGIPLLYVSPQFSPRGKLWLSVVVTLYSALMFVVLIWFATWIWHVTVGQYVHSWEDVGTLLRGLVRMGD